jgi:hypothetical protein
MTDSNWATTKEMNSILAGQSKGCLLQLFKGLMFVFVSYNLKTDACPYLVQISFSLDQYFRGKPNSSSSPSPTNTHTNTLLVIFLLEIGDGEL